LGSRRAVAATLVSVIVFTSLLFANAALYAAGNTYRSTAVLSASQQRESNFASLLIGLSAYSALADAQSYLQGHPFDCSEPQSSYLDSLVGSESVGGANQGIEYSVDASWGYAPGFEGLGFGDDDGLSGAPSMIRPFSGYSGGALNLVVVTTIDETELGGLPAYSVGATESVHIPVSLDTTVSLCTSALSAARESLSSLPSCNTSSVDEALGLLRSENPGLDSVEMGASAQRSATLDGAGRCDIQYWVTITEEGIEGVTGTFDWTVLGSGSLST
jgi:hypothetical protein